MKLMTEPLSRGDSPAPESDERTTGGPRVIDSQTLLQGQSEVLIRHNGEVYRLRQTRTGKLLLYK